MNQCDGCRAGWPLERVTLHGGGVSLTHRNPDRSGYPNDIGCTADRYGAASPCELLPERELEAFDPLQLLAFEAIRRSMRRRKRRTPPPPPADDP